MHDFGAWAEAIENIIVGILFSLAKTLEQKQIIVRCVKIPMLSLLSAILTA